MFISSFAIDYFSSPLPPPPLLYFIFRFASFIFTRFTLRLRHISIAVISLFAALFDCLFSAGLSYSFFFILFRFDS